VHTLLSKLQGSPLLLHLLAVEAAEGASVCGGRGGGAVTCLGSGGNAAACGEGGGGDNGGVAVEAGVPLSAAGSSV